MPANVEPELLLFAIGKMRSMKIPNEEIEGFIREQGITEPQDVHQLEVAGRRLQGDPEMIRKADDYERRLEDYLYPEGLSPDTRRIIDATLRESPEPRRPAPAQAPAPEARRPEFDVGEIPVPRTPPASPVEEAYPMPEQHRRR